MTFVNIAILALSTVAGVTLLPALPSLVTIHFGVDGGPDSFVAALLGVPLVPAISVGALLITRLANALSIRTDTPPVFGTISTTSLACVQTFVLTYNLGARFNMVVAVVPAVVTFGVVVVVLDRAG